jgi:ATP-dependent RNA helicase DHX37/DHR1
LIKYLTDGILLNEMSSDYMLNSYSVIVVDEAHERKVNTDILIGLLSKLVLLRYKLSL